MKSNKFFSWFIMLLVLGTFELSGQDYAGPDVTVCPGKSIPIGRAGSGSFCYKWSPETGLNDPTSPNPTASPTETTTYTVEVTSGDLTFQASDAVTVTVAGIQRIMVTPKKCCWKKDEKFIESDFEIVKIPADIIGDITFDPPEAPFSWFEGGESSEQITVNFKCGDTITSKQVTVDVVDEDFKVSVAAAQFNINQAPFINKVCNSTDKIREKMKVAKIAACQPDISCNFTMATPSFGKICCNGDGGKCVRDNFELEVSGGISGGVQCIFPFYGVPFVASANLAFSSDFSVDLSYSPIKADCKVENKQCIKASPSLNISLGLVGCLGPCDGDGRVVRVQAGGTATFSSSQDLEFCWPSGESEPIQLCGQLDLDGSVIWASLFSQKFKVNIIPKGCL
jgi:hypothetical protein